MPMSKPKLTEEDFRRAANRLRCEVPAIKAVAKTESAGAGFYGDGFPVILYERHLFKRLTKGKYNTSHPHLSGSQGNYGPAGKNQRVKFSQAFALDPDAAMMSCSWGKFQILGLNHKICGFDTVGEFVEAMKESEGRHLDAFVAFVIGNKLDKALRDKNWAAFARGYNGPGYAKNRYDIKMADAYRKFVSEAFDLPISAALAQSSELQGGNPTDNPLVAAGQPPINSEITETKTTEVVQTGDVTHAVETTEPKGDPPDADPTKVTKNGPISNWLFSGGGVLAIGSAIWGFVQSNLNAVAVGIICFTLLTVVIIFRKALTDAIRMQTAADPDKKNVT